MTIQASAFPRLSQSGRRLLAGEKTIVVDQSIDVGPGTSGQWGDDEQIFFVRQPDGAFMEWHSGAPASVINAGFNAFSVGGKNRWAGYSAARGVVQFDNGHVEPGWSGPALSSDPGVWAAVIHARGEIVTSHGRPQRFADRDCRDLRWCGRALVWNVYVLGRWQIAGCREPGAIVDLLNIEPEEFAPVPLMVDGELWLMTHSHDRLLLRPWGLRTGYVVATGITNTPDAKQTPDGDVRVVWDAGHNVLGEYVFDPVLNTPIDLTPQPPQGDIEWTSTAPIDTLPLFVGEPANWPRTGSHDLHQVWDGRNLHLIKFASSDSWERWVLDGNAWYLREDRSQSGAGDYSFHDGLWCLRHAQLGVWNERPNNTLQRYEPGTCKVIDQHKLPYRTALIKAWRRIDCGGDIGVVTGSPAAVLLAYDPGSQQDTWEQYLFVRGWGLVRWMVQEQDDPSTSHTTTFNLLSGTISLTPTQGCWRDLVPWPPVNQQVSMTIIEPTAYPATAAGNRLRVVCGPDPGSHWSTWVEWIYRRVGESTWTQQGERRNPQDDADHTFTFTAAGEFEIGLRWSSGQTGRPRVVRVEGAVVQPPPPSPPEQGTMQIQTNDRQHFITVSASGLGTATQTSSDHATVQLTLVRGDDGSFALRAPNGLVGSAQEDGTFTFDRERAPDWKPDGWEALRAERSPLGGESYVTFHGTRLRVANQGGSELRHDVRDSIDIDETFWPSVSLVSGHGGGPIGGAIGYLTPAGQMRMEGWCMADDNGPRSMLSVTLMDGITQFVRDRARLDRNLAYGMSNGADFFRALGEVDWPGAEFIPRAVDRCVEFLRYTLDKGTRIELTLFGSHSAVSEAESERWTRDVCRAIRDAGLEIALALVEVINEAGGARWSVDRCLRHARIVREFLGTVPLATSAPYSDTADTTTGWEENEAGARAYLRFIESPANIGTPHFDRGTNGPEGQYRICRQPYIAAILGRPYGNNEGAGPGASAQGGDVMRDPNFQRVHANGTWLQKGAFHCWHTNAGVGLSTDSLLESEPGLPGLSAVRAILPPDIANFTIHNWHWGSNPIESLRGVRAGNSQAPVRTHGLVSGGRVVLHILGNDFGAELRARSGMQLTRFSWDGVQYAAAEDLEVRSGQQFFAPPAPDQIYVGRFV